MSLLRTASRLVLAFVVWWIALYPAVAIVGAFVLPPDPFTQLFVLGVGSALAGFAAVVFVRRSSSLRQLGRFAVAVCAVSIVVGFPLSALLQLVGGFGFPLVETVVLVLVAVSYGTGYYLVYESGYDRVKARFAGGDVR